MKLLSWMRTIKQNGGFCCLSAQVPTEVQDIRTNSFSFSVHSHLDLNPPGIEEELRFDEDGFCGFLAIGTLGTESETPKFPASIAEENVSEGMSKLITEKLEKFLEECPEDISRSKRVERSKAEGDSESNVCPLQGYELTKRSDGGVKKRKGLLTSLFKKRKTVERKCGTRDLIKRIFEKSLKMRNVDDDDSMPKKKDLRKTAQNFRSKVHPVLSTPARDEGKIDDIRRSCINSCDFNVPSLTGEFLGPSSISEANGKRENWIKTDAEYLVLEL